MEWFEESYGCSLLPSGFVLNPNGHSMHCCYLPAGLDKGGADLIADGRIKIKQGSTPVSFTQNGLVFSDGSTLRADAVIFA